MQTKAVLILAGLADPCGNIGTECRYDLLPLPCSIEAFTHPVIRILQADQCVIATEEMSQDSIIGVRCWVCQHPKSKPLLALIEAGWSELQGRKAAKLIDSLSQNMPVIEYAWPCDDLADKKVMSDFYTILFQTTK